MNYPVDEAVRYLKQLALKETRKATIEVWRKEYGNHWADMVTQKFLAEWKKK